MTKSLEIKLKHTLKHSIIPGIKMIDLLCSKIYLRLFPEKSSLSTFLFHGLMLNKEQLKFNYVEPKQTITVEQFEEFIKYYLEHGYCFVSPDDIMKGLDKNKKHILITFDDGYYNNTHALPILKKYKVPAVFFVSTNQIKHNKSFWWDVIYRENKKIHKSNLEIEVEIENQKSKTAGQIEEYLIQKYGAGCLKPIGDIDRPFTPEELKKFSNEEFVYIGNHTQNHAILSNYSQKELKEEIINCQKDIYDITGIEPKIISYPNGNYTQDVLNISREIGIKMGITVDPKKNYFPLDAAVEPYIKLGRFVLMGDKKINTQCEFFRSDISLYNRLKNKFK